MNNSKVDVVVPVYKPGAQLLDLLKCIVRQTHPVNRVILINTEEQYFDEEQYKISPKVEVHHISEKEFDHGATRHMGMNMSTAEFVLFMTMDAVPSDKYLVENLLSAFNESGIRIAVAYGRQVPRSNCRMTEQYSRLFNYPEKSIVKTKADMDSLGIKTYFCSDVCAMYDRRIYHDLGGFPQKIIFNEDMIYAAKAINNGLGIAYCSEAQVIHSHNYTLREVFSRNFDMGVSQADHPEVFANVKSETEGIRMVKQTVGYLMKKGHWYEVPYLLVSSMVKYVGYRKGKKYNRLTTKKILRYTSNTHYWV